MTERVRVGEYCIVPVGIISHFAFAVFRAGEAVPLLGPAHTDPDIAPTISEHYHVDWRFVHPRAYRRWERMFYSTVHGQNLGYVVETSKIVSLTRRRLRCRRPMPTFPTYVKQDAGIPIAKWMGDLEHAFSDRRLPPGCRVCPHRGVPLVGPTKDGVTVCPGHGLAWNLRTGELVRRVSEAAHG